MEELLRMIVTPAYFFNVARRHRQKVVCGCNFTSSIIQCYYFTPFNFEIHLELVVMDFVSLCEQKDLNCVQKPHFNVPRRLPSRFLPAFFAVTLRLELVSSPYKVSNVYRVTKDSFCCNLMPKILKVWPATLFACRFTPSIFFWLADFSRCQPLSFCSYCFSFHLPFSTTTVQ